ncbi:MAG: DUF1501 domain-containing protein [Planctomycetes bacterium]|nr:DUF1501 domain-containing protein [Planctomycetota bacterium]
MTHRNSSLLEQNARLGRRAFLRGTGGLLGSIALPSLLRGEELRARGPHHAPRARRVIFLFMAGAPSQMDLYDPKPKLQELDGQPMPESLVAGQPVDQLKGRQLVIAGSRFRFARSRSGVELSELLPNLAGVSDRIAFVHSMHSEIINHEPAQSFLLTGSGQGGRPSCGSWATYGLGSANRDLPSFLVLTSGPPQSLSARLWGHGFLPGREQGVQLLAGKEPVRFLENPPGVDRAQRREHLDVLRELNEMRHAQLGDPAIETRIESYELAFRMQQEVPEVTDLSQEDPRTLALYGIEPGVPSFATNCLLARRLCERGVRFLQLCHGGWDHHSQLVRNLRARTSEVDRPIAALILDLERRGLLDDTLIVCAGEFGRTPMNQGGQTGDRYGRDHHGQAFSVWLAGGGIRGGAEVGKTDELGYRVVEDPVSMHDLHATMLHLLGFDHEKLTFRHQGRDYRLTDVSGEVVRKLLV